MPKVVLLQLFPKNKIGRRLTSNRAKPQHFVNDATALATACTWVDLKPAAKDVQIGYAGDIAQCERVGLLTVNTQSKLLVERNEAKIQKELYTLARNNAASMGATNLVQHGMPEQGEQSFTAYRCSTLG